jgi:hypothetical protein
LTPTRTTESLTAGLLNWHRRLQALTAVIVVGLLALVLVACGGDDSTTTSTSSTSSSTASSTTTSTSTTSNPADFEAMAAVRTAQVAIETLATDNAGRYSGATAEKLAQIEPTLADAELTVDADAQSYTLTVDTRDNSYSISRASNGRLTYPCGSPGEGECGPDGSWNPHP